MPIHDWTKAKPGRFFNFYFGWTIHLKDVLNMRLLPEGYYALSENRIGTFAPETLEYAIEPTIGSVPTGGCVSAGEPIADRRVLLRDVNLPYARKRIVIRTAASVVAMIEFVTPEDKSGSENVGRFVEQVADMLRGGIHVVIIDLLSPGPADPYGLHPLLWKTLGSNDPQDSSPADRPLTLAGYISGVPYEAYLNYSAIGKPLPDVPLFLKGDRYVNLPLEESYMTTFNRLPAVLKAELE